MTVSCSTHQIQYICFLFKLSMCKLYSQKPGMLKGCVLSLGQSQFAQAKKNSKRKTQKKVPRRAIMLQVQLPIKTCIIDNKYNFQDAVDIDAFVCNHSTQNMFIFILVSGFSRVEEIFLASLQSWQLPEAVSRGPCGLWLVLAGHGLRRSSPVCLSLCG